MFYKTYLSLLMVFLLALNAQASLILSGTVVEGDKEARTLGFPTANISFYSEDISIDPGVYPCNVVHDNTLYKGMGYTDKRRPDTFEVHIFGLKKEDIYGDNITIQLFKLLRKPEDFTTNERLKELLKKDAENCQAFFKETK